MAQKQHFKWKPVLVTFVTAAVFWGIAGGYVWGWDRVLLWAFLGAFIFTAGELARQFLLSSSARFRK